MSPVLCALSQMCDMVCPGKIWLDNVICSGTEKSIEKCNSRGWGNSDCTHDEDAGIVCKDERLPGFADSNIIEVSHSAIYKRDHRQFLTEKEKKCTPRIML